MSRRLVLRVSFILSAAFGLSLFVAAVPANAQPACTVVDTGVEKTVAPQPNVPPGDTITHTIKVTAVAVAPASACDVDVDVVDAFSPNQTFSSSTCPGTLSGSGQSRTCAFTITATPGGTTVTFKVFTSTAPSASGPACDTATVFPTTAAEGVSATPQPNSDFDCTTIAQDQPTPPPNGGGGDTDEFEDGGFGFGGGFGGFGTGFSTASTPLGGVDTGAGGTAGSDAAVPQISLASLLTLGFLLFGLRRLRRA